MIAKERLIPIRVQKLDALLRRIPKNHIKRAEIEEEQSKRWAGYRGEQSADFHLSKLPEKEYMIFHGLRLTNGHYFFQIDTLILTSKFALILEVKNYSGTLYFDPIANQLIQIRQDGKEKGYPNPAEQANQQRRELKNWLEKRNFTIPIEFLVIISKPSTIIKTEPGHSHIFQKVLHVQYLLSRIEKIEMTYQKERASSKELKRISRIMLKEHVPETFDILKFYKIPRNEIMTGVICPVCTSFPMKRHFGTWFCLHCHNKDKHAHIQAVTDYFLLNNDSPISNQQIREFLQLSSADTARSLINAMKLPSVGSNKGRVYLPY